MRLGFLISAFWILIILYLALCPKAKAEPYITAGYNYAHSHERVAGAGIRLKDIEYGVTYYGTGTYYHGTVVKPIKRQHLAQMCRLSTRGLCKIGISRIKGHPDIGKWNFHFGLGWLVSPHLELWITHDSSFGVYSPNRGSDLATMVFRF